MKPNLHACASCFGTPTQKCGRCAFRTHSHNKRTPASPNCRIPPGACFINTSHSSTGLPTEDYGELLECHLCFPDQARGTVAKHGGTKGSAQIRHLHTRHQGVMSRKESGKAERFWCRNSGALTAAPQLIRVLSDLRSKRNRPLFPPSS